VLQLARATDFHISLDGKGLDLSIRINQAARLIIAGTAVLATTLGCHAQGLLEMQPEIRTLHLNGVFPSTIGRERDGYRLELQDRFYRYDATGDGLLTAEDPVFFTIVQRTRARGVKRPWVMDHDFNGDGVVSESEIRRGVAYDLRYYKRAPASEISREFEKAVAEAIAADADGNGLITSAEAEKLREGFSLTEHEDIVAGVRNALWAGIGPTKGEISYESFMSEGEKWFRDADADNDGVVSQEEFRSHVDKILKAVRAAPPK
jgi:Ca2+-binding EF-hand superfamily protein